MSDTYSFTPTSVNESCLRASLTQPGTGVTPTNDVVPLSTTGTPVTVTDVGCSDGTDGLLAIEVSGGSFAEGDLVYVQDNDPGMIGGYYIVLDISGDYLLLNAPCPPDCFFDETPDPADFLVAPTQDIVVGAAGNQGICNSNLPYHSVNTITGVTSTVYTSDYCAFFGNPNVCQRTTQQDSFGADQVYVDHKVWVSTGVTCMNSSTPPGSQDVGPADPS